MGIHSTELWRYNLHLLRTKIAPLINEINELLSILNTSLDASAKKNTQDISEAIAQTIVTFVVSGLILLSIILSAGLYFIRQILAPIESKKSIKTVFATVSNIAS